MIVLRVPYPLGFYAKAPTAESNVGWKGRGPWTSGDRAPWLIGRRQRQEAHRGPLPAPAGPTRALSAARESDDAAAQRCARCPLTPPGEARALCRYSLCSGRVANPFGSFPPLQYGLTFLRTPDAVLIC
jgi:hypothetical protein